MKNNIKTILDMRQMSIRQLAKKWDKPYAYTYNLATREDVKNIPIGTLMELANLLEVDLDDLYNER